MMKHHVLCDHGAVLGKPQKLIELVYPVKYESAKNHFLTICTANIY